MKFTKNERHIVIRSYTYDVDDQTLLDRFGSVERFQEILSHMTDDEWAEPQGEAPTDDELDQLNDITDGGSIQSGDYWLTDDKGGTEVSYEINLDL